MPRRLIYTIAFDTPNAPVHQLMAKMLVSSIFRTGFDGDVLVFTNQESRVFEFGRKRLKEVRIDIDATADDFYYRAQTFKYHARHFFKASAYSEVIFIDVDCLCLQNPILLKADGADIRYATEPFGKLADPGYNAYLTTKEKKSFAKKDRRGINSGTFTVRGAIFDKVMKAWEKVDSEDPCCSERITGDQPAWVRVILDTKYKAVPYTDGALRFPLWERTIGGEIDAAILLHYCGAIPSTKVSHLAGNYLRRFHLETLPSLLSFIDG